MRPTLSQWLTLQWIDLGLPLSIHSSVPFIPGSLYHNMVLNYLCSWRWPWASGYPECWVQRPASLCSIMCCWDELQGFLPSRQTLYQRSYITSPSPCVYFLHFLLYDSFSQEWYFLSKCIPNETEKFSVCLNLFYFILWRKRILIRRLWSAIGCTALNLTSQSSWDSSEVACWRFPPTCYLCWYLVL